MPHFALFLFGPPRIERDGQLVKIGRHKATALLAYLVTNSETHSRNALAALLWPNYDQSRARAALRRVLVTLNKAGLGALLQVDRDTIEVKPTAGLWVDVTQFRAYLADCLATKDDTDTVCLPLLTKAVSLYKADFMSGFSLRDSSTFEEWQLFQAETLRRDLSSALARLVRSHSNAEEFETAIIYVRRWLEIDPLYERAHRWLMQIYVWNNQRVAALRQYRECVQILEKELNVSASAETQELYERIQRGDAVEREQRPEKKADLARQAAPLLHNFPAQPTPFVGRQQELREIAERFQNENCRLLTLTGPGGIGKTRLAIQAAIEHRTAFSDGLYFVPLASIDSADFLVSTIADHLNITLDGQEDPRPQLINHLRQKELLLVLDNFEHLIRRADLLANILTEAPEVKILVTSQERLNLQREWIFEVKGMNYPSDLTTTQVENFSAVALFLQRAYRVNSDFSLSSDDKAAIIRICQLVEGVPLAIELAAAWIRVLSCREIVKEIEAIYTSEHSLDFLASSLRDVPDRHRTLRGVFEHSWQLLSAEEQGVFRKLSVFRGGGQREAIEWVTEADLMLISTLVDKSLLTRNASGRYEMHELLRQFAAEKLQQGAQEAKFVQDRHCAYYTAFLKQQENQLKGIHQKETLADIVKEIENIRVAWRWAIAQGKIDQIKAALESLWQVYAMYSWFQEGVEAFGRAVETLQKTKDSPENQQVLGRIMAHLGWFFLRQGLYEQAKYLLNQSLHIFQDLDDRRNLATPLNYLGILAGEVGNPAEAKELLQESLAIYREANDRWGVAWSLSNLAYHASELNEIQRLEAKQLLQESLSMYQTIGNKQGIGFVLNNLGYIAYKQGQYSSAEEFLQKSLALRREVGFPRGIAVTLNNLGHVYEALGNHQTGKACYYEGLQIATDIRTIPLALNALGGIAVCLVHDQEIDQAMELLDLVLHHPASNKETIDRAVQLLDNLNPDPKLEAVNRSAITVNLEQSAEAMSRFDALVARILAS